MQNHFWGNPSSIHLEGEEAKKVLEEARTRIARILHCRSSEIFFTSGGTESLNLAIFGVLKLQGITPDFVPHVICSSVEHPAVLEPIKNLLKDGRIEISFINPNKNGIISPESIKKELKRNTVLVIVQHSNNEIGTIQPIVKISRVIKDFRGSDKGSKVNFPYLLVDAVQSVLYEDVSLERLGADIIVLDGIKMYGPRGIGVLAVRHNVEISPIIFGGGQEGGLRSGTPNVSGACGFAKALEIAVKIRDKESKRLTALRDYAVNKILKEFPNISLNGSLEDRLPNNINICIAVPKSGWNETDAGLSNIDSEFLVIKLDTLGFAVSAASACHALSLENYSYVVEAVSGKECSSSSLRITLGRATKKSDLDALISALKKII